MLLALNAFDLVVKALVAFVNDILNGVFAFAEPFVPLGLQGLAVFVDAKTSQNQNAQQNQIADEAGEIAAFFALHNAIHIANGFQAAGHAALGAEYHAGFLLDAFCAQGLAADKATGNGLCVGVMDANDVFHGICHDVSPFEFIAILIPNEINFSNFI